MGNIEVTDCHLEWDWESGGVQVTGPVAVEIHGITFGATTEDHDG